MAEENAPGVSSLSAELSGLSLLEKTNDSALDKRINESLKRLTKQLDKAKEHQQEGKRLFREIEEIENKAQAEQEEVPAEEPVANEEEIFIENESRECQEPNEAELTPEVTPVRAVSEPEDVWSSESSEVSAAHVRRASIRSPTTDDIVVITRDVEPKALKVAAPIRLPRSSSASRASARRSSSSSRYSDVQPRYMQPLARPNSFLRSEKPADPFVAEHAKMNAAFGYNKVRPRLYVEKREVRKPKDAPPKKEKDVLLQQHKVLKRQLGYNKVRSRLFDNTYGLSDEGSIQVPFYTPASHSHVPAQGSRRSSTPVIRGRSPSLTKIATPRRSSTPVCVPGMPGYVPLAERKSPIKVRSKRLRSCTPATRTAAEGSACWEEVESLLKLASTNEREGDYESAEKLHLEVLKIRRKVQGGDDPSILSSLVGLSMLAEKAEKWVACEVYCNEVIQTTDRLVPDKADAKRVKVQVRLGVCLVQLAKYEEAQEYLKDLLVEVHMLYSPDHTVTCATRYWLAQAANALGKVSEATELQKLNTALGYTDPNSPRAPRMSRSGSVQSHSSFPKRRLSV